MSLPLEGVVVADFSRVLAGPLASSTLADLGATVVKVERSGVGDDTRQWGPPWTARASSYFESANRTKRSIELDFADPSDLAVAHRLASVADVVIENFRAGRLERFGLDYASVRASNPRVVYCSISGFGSRGGADLPGYDFIVQAVGGLMSITGQSADDPVKAGVALVDVLASKDAVIGIQAALAERERSGEGQQVEVNLLSSQLAALVNQASAQLATGVSPVPMGNRHPSIAPYETLRCRGERLAVACGNDGQFARLAEVIGLPGLAADPRFARNADRVQHREALVGLLEEALDEHDAEHWSRLLAEAGLPVGVVRNIAQAFELAESLGLDPLVDMGEGEVPQVRHPVTYSRTVPKHPTPPPLLGEHNEEIRLWLANLANEEKRIS